MICLKVDVPKEICDIDEVTHKLHIFYNDPETYAL